MDVKEFCEQSVGRWFVQRTNYDLRTKHLESSQSEISIESLDKSDRRAVDLCQGAAIDPECIAVALAIGWDNQGLRANVREQGSTVLVLIGDSERPDRGQLLQAGYGGHGDAVSGHFLLKPDASLTLTAELGEQYFEERQWFVSENLRLRTVLNRDRTYARAAFYSEIRRLSPKS